MPGSPSDRDTDMAALENEAIDWVVRLQSGDATAVERAAFAAWRGRSAAHEAAARDAEALWHDFGRTPTARAHARENASDETAGSRVRNPGNAAVGAAGATGYRRSRNMWHAAFAGGIAACLIVAVLGSGMLGPISGIFADHATLPGERREVRLPDGSTATLNTASAISVSYAPGGERRIELHDGEALFDVGPDAARPFVVATDSGEVRVLGTVFAVRNEGQGTRVTVLEGRVRMSGASESDAGTQLEAGQQASVSASGVGPTVDVDAGKETAWARGRLIFNQRPLSEVVAELDRYRAGRVVIADGDLEQLLVTGVFDLNEPDAALDTLERTIGATVVRLPLITVIH